MQKMKNPLILAFASLFLVNCGGTFAQKPKISGDVVVSQSKKTQSQAKPVKPKASPRVKKSKTPLQESVFSPKRKGLSANVLQYLLVAEIAGQRGKLDVAVANYLQAAKLSQDAGVAERASRIAIFARKDKAALEAGKIWVHLAPNNAEAHEILAAMLVRAGNIEGALKHFERVLSFSHKNEQKTFMLITALLSKERDKNIALDIMKRLIDKHPKSSSAYYAYANLALLTKEYKLANKAIDKALRFKKHWNEAAVLKATILHRLGKNNEAIAWLAKELQQQPNNYKLRLYFARKLVDEKKYSLAYKEFNKVYTENKNEPALYAMGLLANRMNKINLARKNFILLSGLSGHKNEADFYLGQIDEKEKNYTKAIDWYSKVQSGVYAFESHLRIIILLGKQGKVSQAREQVKNIHVNKPNEQVRLYIVEGEVLRENKMYTEALELYTDGLNAIPDNLDLLYARALVYEKLDRIDDAVSDLRHIVKLDPQNIQTLNALGYTLVDKTKHVQEGMEYIQQAYQLRPTDPAIIDSMGWAYYRLGKLDKAVTFLKRAFATFNDAEVAAHLGEVLWVRGDKEEARRIWKNSLRETPKHDSLLNVIKRFKP